MTLSNVDIFGSPLFKPVDLTGKKEGIVVGNKNLISKGYIEVYIQELSNKDFPLIPTEVDVPYNEDSTDSSVLGIEQISKANYIRVYPFMFKETDWKTKDQKITIIANESNYLEPYKSFRAIDPMYQRYYLPDIGEKVLVEFIDGDPKRPIFFYGHYPFRTEFPNIPNIPDQPIDHGSDNGNIIPPEEVVNGKNWYEYGYTRILRNRDFPTIGNDVKKYKMAVTYTRTLMLKDPKMSKYGAKIPVFKNDEYQLFMADAEEATIILQSVFGISENKGNSSFRPGEVGPVTFNAIMNYSGFDDIDFVTQIKDPTDPSASGIPIA